jgi:hypothetical protein
MADSSRKVVYFSDIFDRGLNPEARLQSNVIGREFGEYLKGRYDFNAPENFYPPCPARPDAETTLGSLTQ